MDQARRPTLRLVRRRRPPGEAPDGTPSLRPLAFLCVPCIEILLFTLSEPQFPLPVESEPFSMPGDDRIRLDGQEAVTPFGPAACETDPENPIRWANAEPSLIGSLKDNELVAESKDF